MTATLLRRLDRIRPKPDSRNSDIRMEPVSPSAKTLRELEASVAKLRTATVINTLLIAGVITSLVVTVIVKAFEDWAAYKSMPFIIAASIAIVLVLSDVWFARVDKRRRAEFRTELLDLLARSQHAAKNS